MRSQSEFEAQNKEIIRHWIEQLDARNVAIYDELLAEGAVMHFPGGVTVTREEAIKGEEAWYTAFPDTHHTIEDLVADGDKVVLREHVKGTHRAEFQGIPPSGREVTMSAMLMYRLAEGKIVEIWAEGDLTGFVGQLADS
ncbi:ester cyclase [Gemmatimonadota bacterium]